MKPLGLSEIAAIFVKEKLFGYFVFRKINIHSSKDGSRCSRELLRTLCDH